MFKPKTKKFLFFSLVILIFAIPTVAIVANANLSSFSPFEVEDDTEISFTGGDVIKNFKIDSFNGKIVSSGGTVSDYSNKIKFEVGTWRATQNDVKTISIAQVGDMVYTRYQITMRNDVNIMTNIRPADAVGTGKTLDPITEKILAGTYWHYNTLDYNTYAWNSYIEWQHLDVGNIRDKNTKDHTFSGDLVMSFDIDDTPLPDVLVDSNGNQANKSFAYISIAQAYTSKSSYGKLSTGMPTIVGLTPAEYDSGTTSVKSGGSISGTVYGGYSKLWNPNIALSSSFLLNTADNGILPATVGASLNPKTKSGAGIWSPTEEKSMTDCKISYNVGTISPLVYEYAQRLTFDRQYLRTQDWLDWFTMKCKVKEDTNQAQTYTRTVALHVLNRYIRAEVAVVFDVYSAYEVEAIETDIPGLQEPREYYDNLTFGSVIDGFGGGSTYVEEISLFGLGSTASIVVIVIIVIVVIVVVYIFYKQYNKRKEFQAIAGLRK